MRLLLADNLVKVRDSFLCRSLLISHERSHFDLIFLFRIFFLLYCIFLLVACLSLYIYCVWEACNNQSYHHIIIIIKALFQLCLELMKVIIKNKKNHFFRKVKYMPCMWPLWAVLRKAPFYCWVILYHTWWHFLSCSLHCLALKRSWT